jgi:RNA recognition motif
VGSSSPSPSAPELSAAETALLESPAAALLPPNLNDQQKLAILRARQFAVEQQQKRMLEHQRMMLIHQRAMMAAQAVSAAAAGAGIVPGVPVGTPGINIGPGVMIAGPGFAAPKPQPHKVYVGSLHYDLSEEDIKQLFSAVGTVLSVNVGRDPNTGTSKGYAFVEFAEAEAVARAIQALDGHELSGRYAVSQRYGVVLLLLCVVKTCFWLIVVVFSMCVCVCGLCFSNLWTVVTVVSSVASV